VIERLPRDEWTALIPNAHAGYITWEEFEENQRRLRENAQAIGGTDVGARRARARRYCKGSSCAGDAAIG
jgi:hypothetical protein